ncbi:Outer membrane protein (porin) [Serratia entomophila]|jgi:predicted porin|uniref:Porin n=1 Tax=Serratia entomophila TaxID=42906 RepID=A0ABY5CQB9_9GAMM|nr:autotransporter domain-containing protein [Serratia entomophila]UIW17149.1 autotransporter domain-containing protein [Serratia entomophila]USU99704.1 porin [Serratia entomophila]CAI0697691.1 Outer membrane protein (porin) [Serratia entomophila]CAI0697974.1 Outer membrane protein (porin) [Serratia entomophila]CAI0698013.1 Outer membrane protein (porin) [Serratia entomophila]
MTIKLRALTQAVALGLAVGSASFAAQAEITLLKQDPQAGDPLSRLNFTVGGSIRPQFNMMTGDGDKGSYKRNGFDGGTRFRFAADYYLFDDISWISYYELGVNIPALFDWDHHYADGANNTSRRMLYTGLKSKTWGQLTFGQQNSVYYDVVGVKTDIWDYDMLAQAPGNGINGDYDGSYRSRKMLKYKNSFGDADVYASYLFNDGEYLPGNGLRYKRKGGGSLGVDYHLTPDLTWGAAWNYTRAEMRNPSTSGAKSYDQNILGTAISWKPDNWTLTFGGGWYNNFLTTKKADVDNYFAGDAWGIEYLAGYTVPVGQYAVKSVMPYFMGDRLEYVSGRNYQRIDNGLGVTLQFDYGFRVDVEHVLTSSTDNLGDMTLVRLRYDF